MKNLKIPAIYKNLARYKDYGSPTCGIFFKPRNPSYNIFKTMPDYNDRIILIFKQLHVDLLVYLIKIRRVIKFTT